LRIEVVSVSVVAKEETQEEEVMFWWWDFVEYC
jgi:hypothetical protein